MVQNPSAPFVSNDLLERVLGQPLSEQEISKVRQHITVIEPTALKAFWSSEDAESGIYIRHSAG